MHVKNQLENYLFYLKEMERAELTIKKYRHDILAMLTFCHVEKTSQLTKDCLIAYKQAMQQQYVATTVNAAIAAINGFLKYIGRNDCCLRPLRVQHASYRNENRELKQSEYFRLLKVATHRNPRTACLLETICSTGIRVSEVRYITAESKKGFATICNKGKIRVVVLPDMLCSHLKEYCHASKIEHGPIFVKRNGHPIHRATIWHEFKKLCVEAQVKIGKVFPHNLRHLFAMAFYHAHHDLEHLACILGHSNINTTRIYTRANCAEYRKQINALILIR